MMNWLKFYFNKIIFLKDEKFNTVGQKGIEKESYIGVFFYLCFKCQTQ